MRVWGVLAVAVIGLTVARAARVVANAEQAAELTARPYAPSPSSAPIVALGYRELAADLLFVRLVGYFGSADNEAPQIAALAEAIAALDPAFERPYEFGAIAMTAARRAVDNSTSLRAIALLEQGMAAFPDRWRLPKLAGEIYLTDLVAKDPEQRRAWDQAGAALLERASRKPGAPAEAGLSAAVLQTKFGRQQRAIQNLRELLLITTDRKAQQQIIARLSALQKEDVDAIAAELLDARLAFEAEWTTVRPSIPATFFVLIGKPLANTFDLDSLALGGREWVLPTPSVGAKEP